MKKLTLLLIAATTLATTSRAQQYLQFGLHGGFGTTWMINNNVSDQGAELDPQISFAGMGGIHVMAAFTKSVGLQLEVNTATIKQKYKGEDAGSYDFTDRVKCIEVPVLVMLKSSGFYFEIGPKFSFVGKATEDYGNEFGLMEYKGKDVKSGYKNSFISAVLGLGGEFPLTKSKNLMLNAGLRFAYGFNDLTKEYSSALALAADDNVSIGTDAAHFEQKGGFKYKATHVATGHVMLGLSYRLAFGKKS